MSKSHIMLQNLCFGLVLAILLHSSSLSTTASKIRLIHQDSVLSPFHKLSISGPNDDVRSPLSPDKRQTLFLVNVSIGEPSVPQFLAMDTGSELTWVCTTCSTDLGPQFDPKRSSSYKVVSCEYISQCLDYYGRAGYCTNSQCSYEISYSDGSYSNGVLATDKFTFETSSEGLAVLPDIPFGSGLENQWKLNPLTGIFGLKPSGAHSLLSVVGNKFSYCLGNISDPSYMYNLLILGNGSAFEGPSTPIRQIGSQYMVNLQGISVGGVELPIDQKEFGFNSLIDSGTTSTILTRGLLDPIKREVKELLDGILQPVELGTDHLCYSGNLVRDLKGLPTVTLHFAGGADLDLSAEALFQRLNDNAFCLAMDASADGDNIIGVYAQQFYNLGFDMNAMTVSIQNIDCSLLDE